MEQVVGGLEWVVVNSFFVFVDMVYGVHLNFVDFHDVQYKFCLNGGFVIKTNVNMCYVINVMIVVCFCEVC